jgi:hypothetical protein
VLAMIQKLMNIQNFDRYKLDNISEYIKYFYRMQLQSKGKSDDF